MDALEMLIFHREPMAICNSIERLRSGNRDSKFPSRIKSKTKSKRFSTLRFQRYKQKHTERIESDYEYLSETVV